MLRVVLGLAALAACATVVLAQNTGAITARKDAMKALGGATKDPGAIAKGEAPFDLAKVQASLKTIEEIYGLHVLNDYDSAATDLSSALTHGIKP